jgi:hypothetical protein
MLSRAIHDSRSGCRRTAESTHLTPTDVLVIHNGFWLAVYVLKHSHNTSMETCSSHVPKQVAVRNYAICRLKM